MPRTPLTHQVCDSLSAALIIFLTLATPWFYGTTEEWSIWTMNIVCFALGLLLLTKQVVRWLTGFTQTRWVEGNAALRWFTRVFFALNLFALAFCFTAAWNARATFLMKEQRFEYHENYIPWLPFSYDSTLSWFVFWQYLGLFFFFWALRDWLIGKSKRERRRVRRSEESETTDPMRANSVPLLPDRLRLLLWIVCLNGMVLSIEAVLQRLDGTPKLLWMRNSWWATAESCFGPYSYRSNAAQYINLIWPVSIGFWWMLNEARRSATGKPLRLGEGPHLLLIPASIIMAAAPVISTSRGGAIVAAATLILVLGVLMLHHRTRWATRLVLILLCSGMILTGWILGWETLWPRLRSIEKDNWSNRGEIYDNSKQIATDFPRFGTGPGTFRSVYQLYRESVDQPWQAFLHDDWLETRVTFGQVGMAILLANLAFILLAWFVPGKIETPSVLPATIYIALFGCLVHAKFDFPLQTYSILYLFILLCCVLFCLSKRSLQKA